MDIISLVQEPLQIEIWQGNDWTVVSAGTGSESNTTGVTFLSLTDTPDTYEGQAGKTPVVNDKETGLVFKNIVPAKFITLSDCPSSYKNAAGKLVRVKSDNSGLEFVNVANGEIEDFTQLADVPGSYEGASEKVVAVTQGENGLEFKQANDLLKDQLDSTKQYTYPKLTVNEKGIITAIESQPPGTILPPFEKNHLLYGDGSNIPATLDNGEIGQTLISKGVGGLPTFTWGNTLYGVTGKTVLRTDSNSDKGYIVTVNSTDYGMDIVSGIFNNPTSSVDMTIRCSGAGTLFLGNANNTIELKTKTTVRDKLWASVDNLTLVPIGNGTINVDISQTAQYSYTANVLNENDLANKGYVDKAIEEALDKQDRVLSVSNLIAISPASSTTKIADSMQGKILDEIKILVSSEFNGSFYVSLGDDVDNDYLSDGLIELSGNVGLITVPLMQRVDRDAINLYITSSDNNIGSATLVCKWY